MTRAPRPPRPSRAKLDEEQGRLAPLSEAGTQTPDEEWEWEALEVWGRQVDEDQAQLLRELLGPRPPRALTRLTEDPAMRRELLTKLEQALVMGGFMAVGPDGGSVPDRALRSVLLAGARVALEAVLLQNRASASAGASTTNREKKERASALHPQLRKAFAAKQPSLSAARRYEIVADAFGCHASTVRRAVEGKRSKTK